MGVCRSPKHLKQVGRRRLKARWQPSGWAVRDSSSSRAEPPDQTQDFTLNLQKVICQPSAIHQLRGGLSTSAMPHDHPFAAGGPEEAPIMQVREEAHWPFAPAAERSQEQVIAGVLKEPGQEKLSIRQAMQRGLLTHGTGLALLEHQAASGYIMDLASNRMLSVRDAKNAGLLDREHLNTLLIAEKAVTGYTDPFSGNKISLFQAMRKGLIIKDHGIRLLEAQVATGGLIHPMHSHRLPPEVAYKWGYLDAELFHWISDPANHTKRCFDPNARENLTYLQLLPRCVLDPDTGLLLFQVVDKGSVHLDESLRECLKSATTQVHVGIFQGQEVSAWDLLFSSYVPHSKRQELLRQYKAGTLTAQEVIQILTSIITETEGYEERPIHGMTLREGDRSQPSSERELTENPLKSRMVHVSAGEFRGQKVSVWEVLHSKCIPKGKRKELLKLYREGILTLDQMETVVTAIVAKTEEEGRAKGLGRGTGRDPEEENRREAQLELSLQKIHVPVRSGELKGQNVPVPDLLFSKHFPRGKRQQLLELYKTGVLSPGQMAAAVGGTWEKVEAGRKSFLVRMKPRRSPEAPRTTKEARAADASLTPHCSDELLKAKRVTLPAGEFQGQQLSVWDLLFSQYITRDKGEELLRKYREGRYTVEELASMLTILASLHDLFYSLEQTPAGSSRRPTGQGRPRPLAASLEENQEEEEEEEEKEGASASDDDKDDDEDKAKDEVLKTRMVEVPVGKYRGRKVSVWDLLHSKYFPEKKRKEVLKLYRIGILTADQVATVATAIVTKLGEEKAAGGRHASTSCRREKPRETAWERPPTFDFPVGEFHGQRVCMWDLLFSASIPEAKRQELLTRYMTGLLSGQEMVAILTALVTEAHKTRSTPNVPQALGFLHPEAPAALFGLPGTPGPSMHDLFSPQEQEGHTAGRVMVSEVTVTTTVLQAPEQKQA
ncbi:epiplakin [Pogona vitticeps]